MDMPVIMRESEIAQHMRHIHINTIHDQEPLKHNNKKGQLQGITYVRIVNGNTTISRYVKVCNAKEHLH